MQEIRLVYGSHGRPLRYSSCRSSQLQALPSVVPGTLGACGTYETRGDRRAAYLPAQSEQREGSMEMTGMVSTLSDGGILRLGQRELPRCCGEGKQEFVGRQRAAIRGL